MLEPHLRSLQNRLRTKMPALNHIDLWNLQTSFYEKEGFSLPSVFIHFGVVQWRKHTNGIKVGTANIAVHCVGKHIRATTDRASDTNNRLSRLDLCNEVMQALQGYTGYDADENTLIKGMDLDTSEPDSNHDALTDDVLTFSCLLYYYDTWNGKNMQEIVLQGVQTQYDAELEM